MKNFFNTGIVYILLWCLYSLQGTLYASGGVISRLLLLVLLMWSIYSCYIVNFKLQQTLPAFVKAVNVFLIMATIYGSLLMIGGQELFITEYEYIKVSNFEYLKTIYISFLPLYTIYYYVQKGYIRERHIGMLLLLFIAVTWMNYFRSIADSLARAIELGSTREEFTNNVGYSFLSILPLLLYWNKKPILQYVLFLVCIAGIILCMKRGAIIIGVLCFVFFVYSTFKTTRGIKKFAIVFLSILAIVGVVRIVQNMLTTSEYFVTRLEATLEGDSSNRDIIYTNLWNVFINESNPLKILFGRGANATLTVGMNYAHNDWLELAINQGFLGIAIYVYYFIALFKDARRARRTNNVHFNVLLISLFILFSKTLFSMSYGSIDLVLILAIALSLGTYDKNINNNSKSLCNRTS